jgi:protein-S-isoprenylcysteine O-methyltransferase Ste14
MKPNDSPGVFIPPPLIYAAIFFVSLFLQKKVTIDNSFFEKLWTRTSSILFLLLALIILLGSLNQFVRSKNSVITIKAAASLQTKGVYQVSRNPMYLGLALLYLGFTCYFGNWWNVILFPLLLVIVQEFVIKREERYLKRRFGKEYDDYQHAVRRWL